MTIDNVIITAEPTGYTNTFTEAVTYVAGTGGALIAAADTLITDPSGGNLAGATIRIATNYQSGADLLEFTNQGGITGVLNAATGTLTLTGNATAAIYTTAIESIRFNNSSGAPSTGAANHHHLGDRYHRRGKQYGDEARSTSSLPTTRRSG